MIKKLNHITYILLVFVFLAPSIVKMEHHHKHFICKAKNEKHYHNYHEKCEICIFDFSFFSSEIKNVNLENEQPSDQYCNNYRFSSSSILSKYSFLLRAPPL